MTGVDAVRHAVRTKNHVCKCPRVDPGVYFTVKIVCFVCDDTSPHIPAFEV